MELLNEEEIAILTQKIANIKWHHSIELEKGVITSGGDNSAKSSR